MASTKASHFLSEIPPSVPMKSESTHHACKMFMLTDMTWNIGEPSCFINHSANRMDGANDHA
jgi:hypothetical protein